MFKAGVVYLQNNLQDYIMLEQFRKFITDRKMVDKADTILLAVSGGMDSMVMTDLFKKAGYEFGIAHCNFSLRDEESDMDEKFVRQLADSINAPFHRIRFDTVVYAESKALSIQMAARELRYQWFEQFIQKKTYDKVAMAHHLDDQIETVFINLLRGTGISGLHGIPAMQQHLIRPLMFAWRSEIENYATVNKIVYRNDSSNNETKYLRNKIRHNILPIIEEIEPAYRKIITSNIQRFSGAERIYLDQIGILKKNIISEKDGQVLVSIASLKKLPYLESCLFEWLSEYDFNADVIRNIIESLENIPGKQFFSTSHRLLRDRKYLVIEKLEKSRPCADNSRDEKKFLLNANERVVSIPIRLSTKIVENSGNHHIPNKPEYASFDLEKLQFPLEIRRWKQGDYFHPFGQDHKKKLSDFFTDNKFSVFEKEKTWLLCSGKNVIWIIGYRIDNKYRVDKKTDKIFEIHLLEKKSQNIN